MTKIYEEEICRVGMHIILHFKHRLLKATATTRPVNTIYDCQENLDILAVFVIGLQCFSP